jgi:hypothetical protein
VWRRRQARPTTLRAQCAQRLVDEWLHEFLEYGERDRNMGMWDAVTLGHHVRGKLGRLAEDQVGSPFVGHVLHGWQCRARVDTAENVSDDNLVRGFHREGRQACEDRAKFVRRAVREGHMVEAGASHRRGE